MPGRTRHASATWVSTIMSRQTKPAEPRTRIALRRAFLQQLVRGPVVGERFADFSWRIASSFEIADTNVQVTKGWHYSRSGRTRLQAHNAAAGTFRRPQK
jgi:hypothetical protein